MLQMQRTFAMQSNKPNPIYTMTLTEKAKKAIRDNRELRAELIKENSIVEFTLLRWLREDHVMLTTKANLLIVEKYTKLTEAEILEPVHA